MHSRLNPAERAHLARIKMMDCAVCQHPAPVEAHHIEQGQTYTCIPLCQDCHRGSLNGLHGQKAMWRIMKRTELSCLNDTVRELVK